MPADNFWDLLATEFRELGKRWPPLVAEWNAVASDAAGGRWRFYPDNIANAELREHFEHLATRAAVALELAPSAIPHPRRHCPSWDEDLAKAGIERAVANGIQPEQENLRAWLEYLRLDFPDLVISRGAAFFHGEKYESVSIRINDLCRISAQECIRVGQRALKSCPPARTAKRSTIGENLDRWRRECGWSHDQLAEKVGLEKSSVNGHINHRVTPRAGNLKNYADAFSRQLKKQITVAELQSGIAEPTS